VADEKPEQGGLRCQHDAFAAAMVEGSIGTIKCLKYGFNRPEARSAAMMGVCGQRAVLGLNLTKLFRGVAGKQGIALAV
jgi:hypothetical protein